jgi:hypothetical protein
VSTRPAQLRLLTFMAALSIGRAAAFAVAPSAWGRVVLTPPHCYMRVRVSLERPRATIADGAFFDAVLAHAARGAFGLVGAPPFTVLHTEAGGDAIGAAHPVGECIVRVGQKSAARFHAALMLCGAYGGQRCRLDVVVRGAVLADLAAPRRA